VRGITSRGEDVGASPHDDAGHQDGRSRGGPR
jgi:hypothetical protein